MRIGKPEEVELKTIRLEVFINLLNKWLASDNPEERMKVASKYENLIGNFRVYGANEKAEELLCDLGHDCAYYTEIAEHLVETPELLNYERFKRRVVGLLHSLGETNK